MKVLNLYAGLGGNRKLWADCDVTAVEIDPDIAKVYQEQPEMRHDTVIVGDAHQYLLDHHDEFDFIWSSPPCVTHTSMNIATRHDLKRYPDMSLYQEIIFLTHHVEVPWIVENVAPYYDVLIPAAEVGRHLFWSNFYIQAHPIPQPESFIKLATVEAKQALMDWLGIHYDHNIYIGNNHDPCQPLRSAVHPELGNQVFKCAGENRQMRLL